MAPPATTAFRLEPSDRHGRGCLRCWGPCSELLRRSCPRVVSPSSGRTLLCRGWGAQKAKIQQVAVCSGDGRFEISDHEIWDTANSGWQCHFYPSFWFKGCSRDASHGARPSTGVPSCLHLICCLTARLGEQSSRVPIHKIEAQQVFKSSSILLPSLVLRRGISFCQLQLFAGLH